VVDDVASPDVVDSLDVDSVDVALTTSSTADGRDGSAVVVVVVVVVEVVVSTNSVVVVSVVVVVVVVVVASVVVLVSLESFVSMATVTAGSVTELSILFSVATPVVSLTSPVVIVFTISGSEMSVA